VLTLDLSPVMVGTKTASGRPAAVGWPRSLPLLQLSAANSYAGQGRHTGDFLGCVRMGGWGGKGASSTWLVFGKRQLPWRGRRRYRRPAAGKTQTSAATQVLCGN
jgi:hypothetical protein